jgi:hypothetical protein
MKVNTEFERMWKEEVVAHFNVFCRHLLGRTEEHHEEPQSE